jgi:hypothetical protein
MSGQLSKNFIKESMDRGVEWLWSARSRDFGWGDHSDRPVDLSGCSESMFGMLKAGVDPSSEKFKQSLSYVKSELRKSPDVSHPRSEQLKSARNLAWPILMLGEVGEKFESDLIQGLLAELDRFCVSGEGWSADVGGRSNVYDTSLVILGLSRWKGANKLIADPLRWIAGAQNADGGFGFKKGENSNVICTSLATMVMKGHDEAAEKIRKAVNWLTRSQKSDGSWDVEFEPNPNYRYGHWIHYSAPYAVLALINAGFPLNSPEVTRGVNAILARQHESGGWKILDDYPPFTHATAHALVALGEIYRRL